MTRPLLLDLPHGHRTIVDEDLDASLDEAVAARKAAELEHWGESCP